MSNINQNILTAIDTIISQKLGEINFDNTIVCEILKVDKDKKEYFVTTGVSAFTAYADVEYFVGQKVYVTIPQNNYSLKKIIVGRYTGEESTAYEYTHPFERLVDMTGNLASEGSQSLEVQVSGANEAPSASKDLDSVAIGNIVIPEAFGSFDYIGLRVTYTTLMEATYEGRYGLKLTLTDTNNQDYEYIFDSTELYGNPYYYDSGFAHEKIFAYPKDIIFKSGTITLYQGDFNYTGSNSRILASDIYICFGYDQNNFEESHFSIELNQGISKTYNTSGDNEKKITASLISFNEEDKKYETYNPTDYELSWYRYRVGNSNVGAGNHWEKLFEISDDNKELLIETASKTKLKRIQEINLEFEKVKDLAWKEEKVVTLSSSNIVNSGVIAESQALIIENENKGNYLHTNRNNLVFKLYNTHNINLSSFSNFDLKIENNLDIIADATFFLCSPIVGSSDNGLVGSGFINHNNSYYKVLYYSELSKEGNWFSFNEEDTNLIFFVNCQRNENNDEIINFRITDPQLKKLYSLLDEYNQFYEDKYQIDYENKKIVLISDKDKNFPTNSEVYQTIEEEKISNPFIGTEFIGKTAEGNYRLTTFPYVNYQKDQIKAQVKFDDSLIESNIIQFDLTTQANEESNKDTNSQIVLQLEDSGHYPFYEDNNELSSNYNNSKKAITVSFADSTPWTAANKIVWKVPKTLPLIINNPTKESGEKEFIESEETDYKIYTLEKTSNEDSITNTLQYTLDSYINAISLSGYIYCYVLDNTGKESNEKVSLSFGKYSSSGTKYLLDVTDENGNRPWKFLPWINGATTQETKYLKAQIIDTETGKPIELTTSEQQKFKWEWVYDFDNNFYSRDLDGSFGDQLEAWTKYDDINEDGKEIKSEIGEKATQISSNFEENGPLKSFQCTSLGEYNIAIIKLSYEGFALENDTEADLVEYFPIPVVAFDKEESYNNMKNFLEQGLKGKTEFVYDTSGKAIISNNDQTPYAFWSNDINLIYGTLLSEDNSSMVPIVKPVYGEGKYEKNLDSIVLAKILYNGEINNLFTDKPYNYDYNGDTLVDDRDIEILQEYEKKSKENSNLTLSNYLESIGYSSCYPISFYLSPAALSLDGSNLPWCSLYLQGKYDNTDFIWQQPIIIRYDTHGTKLLNDWNGELTLDEDNNAVLASLLVAGEKNKQNQFTGVIIGDVQKAYDNIDGYGVYGFKNGINRFKLDEYGNFFVGQGDGSYLKFDDEGFMLNLKSGNFIINANNFSIDANGNVDISGLLTAVNTEIANLKTKDAAIENLITNSLNAVNANITTLNTKVATIESAYITEAEVDTLVAGTISTSTLKVSQIQFTNGDSMSGVFDNASYAGHISAGQRFSYAELLDAYSSTQAFQIRNTSTTDNHLILSASLTRLAGTTVVINAGTGGGTLYGSWKFPSGLSSLVTTTLQASDFYAPRIWSLANSSLDLKSQNGTAHIGSYNGTSANSYISLRANGQIAIKGTNVSTNPDVSDINKKNSIKPLENEYEILFDNLISVKYKYNDGESNRFHTGFIAQEVKNAIDKAGLTTLEFAGLTIQNPETENELWGLRYSEFVALNTWQIQKLKSRVAELENKLAQLE